ncbi:MAG: hypothetical protein P4L84_35010 [Isosphaeraceae bacterium]|nr:hypothetical protein [Isosphaeraceae bacterium]
MIGPPIGAVDGVYVIPQAMESTFAVTPKWPDTTFTTIEHPMLSVEPAVTIVPGNPELPAVAPKESPEPIEDGQTDPENVLTVQVFVPSVSDTTSVSSFEPPVLSNR